MPVDISNVLHVLAHELRTPVGIAHGYLRMLLDDRLQDPADRRRALEQTQKALARVSELSQESSRLAAWLETEHGPGVERVGLNEVIERALGAARVEPAPNVQFDGTAGVSVPTIDANALTEALAAFVRATARELPRHPLVLVARVNGAGAVDLLMGSEDRMPALAAGPDAPTAGAVSLERGGIGLLLLLASAVLDAHGASRWTVEGSRSSVGIRLPSEERAHL